MVKAGVKLQRLPQHPSARHSGSYRQSKLWTRFWPDKASFGRIEGKASFGRIEGPTKQALDVLKAPDKASFGRIEDKASFGRIEGPFSLNPCSIPLLLMPASPSTHEW
jgi:hypothetical protein